MSEQKPEPKPPVVAGGGMAAIVPQDLEQAFRLSQALARGGDMVPKHFQGQPEQIMAAIMRGMEVGLAPMQALSNIAVINGRASLWGDALPALLQKAGHHIDTELVGEGDGMKAVATLTRGDTGKVVVREFSVADAKKANLWGKAGPWQTYPQRMLAMRARSWAVRDGAADALMGLQVAEEMLDAPPIKDVTPKEPGGFAKLAASARQTPPEPQEAAEKPIEQTTTVIEATAQEAPPDAALRALAGDAFPGSDEFTKGAQAFADGKPITACPYDPEVAHQEAVDWCGGWVGAEEAAK